MNILILNVSTGFGHKSVSGALRNCLEEKGDIVSEIDILEYVSPFFNRLFRKYYIKSLKYIPDEIQSLVYEKEVKNHLKKQEENQEIDNPLEFLNAIKEEAGLTDIFSKLIAKLKLTEILKENNPDVIVSTHPFIGELMDNLGMEKKTYRLVTIITDYVAHPSWINDSSDIFICGTDILQYEMRQLKQDMSKIRYLGIPIRRDFYICKEEESLKHATIKKLGLKKKQFTFLLMGGGEGLGKIMENVSLLADNIEKINIVVLCGKNKELKENLENLKKSKGYKQLHILGFTEHVAEIMSVSDALISKPGGVTITESMIMGLPMIIRDFLRGQEEMNTQFLLNNHMAVYAPSDLSFLASCNRLIEDAEYRNNMIQNMKKIAKKDTLEEIYLQLHSWEDKHGEI